MICRWSVHTRGANGRASIRWWGDIKDSASTRQKSQLRRPSSNKTTLKLMVKNLNPPYKLIDISAYLHQLLIPSPIIIEHIHLLSPIYIIYRNASKFHHPRNVSTTTKNRPHQSPFPNQPQSIQNHGRTLTLEKTHLHPKKNHQTHPLLPLHLTRKNKKLTHHPTLSEQTSLQHRQKIIHLSNCS